jgi:hypothetical protein
MNRMRPVLLAALALLLAGCAPTLPRPGRPDVHPGFDLGRYPGEAALRAWRQASPYRWVGYYLPAPCHRDPSWVGTRPTLERLDWGMAVLYVGQQAFEDQPPPGADRPPETVVCSRTLLTAERGRADAQDAIARTRAEGFPPGSTVFLDVERMRRLPEAMAAYYGAWQVELLRDGRYLPGTYAHRDNASALFALAQGAYQQAGRTETPPFWVAGGPGFALDQPPWASGFPFAEVWQGALDVQRTWGGVTLQVDENVSRRPSPSAPRGP